MPAPHCCVWIFRTISGSQMGSQHLQNAQVIEQTDVLLCKIWRNFGSVSYWFSCTSTNDNNTDCIVIGWKFTRRTKFPYVAPENKGTIHPGLRLLPSGNFFLALNRSHHFLLIKVSMYLILQVEHNASNLITLLYILSIFSNVRLSK